MHVGGSEPSREVWALVNSKVLCVNREEGCTVTAIDEAARNGYFLVVQWLLENGKRCSKEDWAL